MISIQGIWTIWFYAYFQFGAIKEIPPPHNVPIPTLALAHPLGGTSGRIKDQTKRWDQLKLLKEIM